MIGQRPVKQTPAEERRAYQAVTLRDQDTCQRCLRNCGGGVTSRHHRKNRSQGGRTLPSNLVVLGGTGTTGCHGIITESPQLARAEGFTVPSWGDPAEFPVRRYVRTAQGTRRQVWVLLDDHGLFRQITDEEARRRMEGRAA